MKTTSLTDIKQLWRILDRTVCLKTEDLLIYFLIGCLICLTYLSRLCISAFVSKHQYWSGYLKSEHLPNQKNNIKAIFFTLSILLCVYLHRATAAGKRKTFARTAYSVSWSWYEASTGTRHTHPHTQSYIHTQFQWYLESHLSLSILLFQSFHPRPAATLNLSSGRVVLLSSPQNQFLRPWRLKATGWTKLPG